MTAFFLIAICVILFVVIFQISKASEYVSVLKGEEASRKQNNKINGFLMISFLILGLIGVWYCNHLFYGKTLLPQGSASVEGESIDTLLMVTIAITGLAFFITQILLFWFSFRYQEKEGKKAFYYPHNNKLEILWTTVPAITFMILVVFGLRLWFKLTGEPPKNAHVVEITGHQFGWDMRYPGKDNVLGKKNYKLYNNPSGNTLGVDFNDPASHDDIRTSEMHLPVGVPVKLVINSMDVIHDVGLNHFRLKMDAVPGIPTTLWFTPKYTTKQMQKRTGNPNFVYEISCDQMCGKGHFTMRGVIVVETKEEYKRWLAAQKSEYSTLMAQNATTPTAIENSIQVTKSETATKAIAKLEAKN
ncbi:MAG TPA: cytochrome c oxidase subunit II [Ferruginibacter sp.]|nr:cytochrome c oxidase subunit II [Niastella sp.]HRB30566.1 cytochrome c oxidase subunit II [Ferruginibacter sp.]